MRYRPTVAEINGYALAHNVKEFVRLAGNAKLMAVVKADAYGHGAPMCARIALANGAAAVAVATAEEALDKVLANSFRNKKILLPQTRRLYNTQKKRPIWS